jgi:hypothetical protein
VCNCLLRLQLPAISLQCVHLTQTSCFATVNHVPQRRGGGVRSCMQLGFRRRVEPKAVIHLRATVTATPQPTKNKRSGMNELTVLDTFQVDATKQAKHQAC